MFCRNIPLFFQGSKILLDHRCESSARKNIFFFVEQVFPNSNVKNGTVEANTIQNRTIYEPIYFRPFENQTHPVFGSPL